MLRPRTHGAHKIEMEFTSNVNSKRGRATSDQLCSSSGQPTTRWHHNGFRCPKLKADAARNKTRLCATKLQIKIAQQPLWHLESNIHSTYGSNKATICAQLCFDHLRMACHQIRRASGPRCVRSVDRQRLVVASVLCSTPVPKKGPEMTGLVPTFPQILVCGSVMPMKPNEY